MDEVIGVAGDWHANRAWALASIRWFRDQGIKKILHLGDYAIWPGNAGNKFRHDVNKLLAANDMKIYVTLGNHEDYVQVSMLNPVPEGEEDAGWLRFRSQPQVLFAKRGQRWNWSGVSFVSLGGANSIDRFYSHRVPNISWWEGEQISLGDIYRTAEGGFAEIFLAHDCPIGVPLFGGHKAGTGDWRAMDLEYAEKSRYALRQAVDAVKPELLLHGHYHFFADHTTTLNDGVEDYVLHSVGLDKDVSHLNMALLHLPSKKLDVIDSRGKLNFFG